jgi:hypothetical protein
LRNKNVSSKQSPTFHPRDGTPLFLSLSASHAAINPIAVTLSAFATTFRIMNRICAIF